MPDRRSAVSIRAPLRHGAVSAVPDLATARQWASQQQHCLSSEEHLVLGRSLPEVRRWTREVLLSPDLSAVTDGRVDLATTPVIVTGHQPEPFHPGVWLKNFATAGLASGLDGVAVNLIVDSDVCTKTSVTLPEEANGKFSFVEMPFDAPVRSRPWEDYVVSAPDVWASLADRVTTAMQPFGVIPLLGTAWSSMNQAIRETGKPAEAFITGRRDLEARWGVRNAEIRMSEVCRCRPFLFLVAAIAAEQPRFNSIYNEVLDEYRKKHRIRGRSHPVPKLETERGRCESPFWVWNEGETARRRVWVEARGEQLTFYGGEEELLSIPHPARTCWEDAVDGLMAVARRGIRLRSRALTTTMFARVFLADLFVHGIGGAKYDEMTDAIIQRMWGVPAPQFLTLTGTAHLFPERGKDASKQDVERLRQRLRDLEQNPERHTDPNQVSAVAERWIDEKHQLIAEQHRFERGELASDHIRDERRYRRFPELRRELATLTESHRQRLSQELIDLKAELRNQRVLHYREFSALLFPEKVLQPIFAETVECARAGEAGCLAVGS